MEKKEKTRLLSEFPAHTEEQWREAAVQLLNGRPFEKTLITPTYEGFDLQPLFITELGRIQDLVDDLSPADPDAASASERRAEARKTLARRGRYALPVLEQAASKAPRTRSVVMVFGLMRLARSWMSWSWLMTSSTRMPLVNVMMDS